MDRIINMVMRMFIGKIMNAGIEKGVDLATRKGGRDDQSREEKQRAKQTSRRLKQGARLTRKIGRF